MEGFYVSQPMGGQPQNPAAAAQAQVAAQAAVQQNAATLAAQQNAAAMAGGYMQVPPPQYMQWQNPAMKPPPMMAPMGWGAYGTHPQMMAPPQPAPTHPYGLNGLSIPRTRGEREDASGRWVLEPEDVLLLERVFALEKCPGRELRTQLAARLHVKPRQIQVWFQNKRQRTKNGAKPTVAEALAHAVYNSEHRTQTEPAELLMSMANAPSAADGENGEGGDGMEGGSSDTHGAGLPSDSETPSGAAKILALASAPQAGDAGANGGAGDTPNGGGGAINAEAEDPDDDPDDEGSGGDGSAVTAQVSNGGTEGGSLDSPFPPPADAAEAHRQALALIAGHVKPVGGWANAVANGTLPPNSTQMVGGSVPPGAAGASPQTGMPQPGQYGAPLSQPPPVSQPAQHPAYGMPPHPNGAPCAAMGGVNADGTVAGAPNGEVTAGYGGASANGAMGVGAPAVPPEPNNGPDGFTDGRSLWVRTDVLAQHPQLLTVHAPPGSVPMPHVRDGVAAAYASDPSGGFAVTGSHGPATAAMPGLAAVGFPPGFNGSVADPSQLKPASMPAQLQGVSLVRSNTGDGVASLLGMAGGAHQQPNTAAAPAQQMGGMPQPGMPQPGMPQPGMPQPGMPQPGMPQPGYTLPGMPQYGDPNQGQHPAMQPHPTLMQADAANAAIAAMSQPRPSPADVAAATMAAAEAGTGRYPA